MELTRKDVRTYVVARFAVVAISRQGRSHSPTRGTWRCSAGAARRPRRRRQAVSTTSGRTTSPRPPTRAHSAAPGDGAGTRNPETGSGGEVHENERGHRRGDGGTRSNVASRRGTRVHGGFRRGARAPRGGMVSGRSRRDRRTSDRGSFRRGRSRPPGGGAARRRGHKSRASSMASCATWTPRSRVSGDDYRRPG